MVAYHVHISWSHMTVAYHDCRPWGIYEAVEAGIYLVAYHDCRSWGIYDAVDAGIYQVAYHDCMP